MDTEQARGLVSERVADGSAVAETVEQHAHEAFVRDVRNHAMTVLRDEGVYRHLKFTQPEHSWNCWFELVTWPGTLCIRGDHGTYVFSRTDDMFQFFRAGGEINPQYWAEKCHAQDTTSPCKGHSRITFEQSVRRWVDDFIENDLHDDPEAAGNLRREITEDVLSAGEYAETANESLDTYSWRWPQYSTKPTHTFRFEDWHEMSSDEYDHHFLWCLYAILWGIRVYDAAGDTSKAIVRVPAYADRPVQMVPAAWDAKTLYGSDGYPEARS